MAFDVAGGASGALGGAAAGAKIGSIIPGVGTAVGAVAGGLIGLFSGGKKTKVEAKPLDIAKIISDARTAAAENYQGSLNLERQFRPESAALRTQTDLALSDLLSGNTAGARQSLSLLDSLRTSAVDPDVASNPLLAESTNRILNNLRLGGALGRETQEMAVKTALERGGAAGIAGSGAVRGLVARDLGLTSLALEQQRIAQAQQAGQTQAQLGLAGQQLRLQDLLGRAGAVQGLAGQETQRIGMLGSLLDARPLPESGLSAGSIANLAIGGTNVENQVNATNAMIDQQRRNQNLNALLGLGSLAASGGMSELGDLFKNSGSPTTPSGVSTNRTAINTIFGTS